MGSHPIDGPRHVVTSRHGLWSVLRNLTAIVLGAGVLLLGALNFSGFLHEIRYLLLSLIMGPVIAYAGIPGLALHVEIDREGVKYRSLWGKWRVRWLDVEEVNVRTNFYGSYGVRLLASRENNRRFSFFTGYAQNGHELGIAILEASSTANPSMRFTGAHRYGPHPFGMFLEASLDPLQDV